MRRRLAAVRLFCLTGRGGIQVPIDWGQSIYHADAHAVLSYSVEPLSPMALRRRASGGVLRLSDFFVSLVAVASRFRSIGDNRSTMPTRSGGVIQCRAIVPNGSATTRKRRRLTAFRLFCLTVCGSFQVPIDCGQSIYHADAQRRCHTV